MHTFRLSDGTGFQHVSNHQIQDNVECMKLEYPDRSPPEIVCTVVVDTVCETHRMALVDGKWKCSCSELVPIKRPKDKQRNAEAARKFRLKKQQEMNLLEEQLEDLRYKHASLLCKRDRLRSELEQVQELVERYSTEQ